MTRQRRWAEKMVQEGRCATCGESRGEGARLCDYHLSLAAKYQRDTLGLHKWRKGHRGRPPLSS